MTFTPKIGVYICHCGINIAATVDVPTVTEFAAHLPDVCVARHYTYMCSDPGQALIKNDIAELNLNRIVVASCSPLMHEPTFRDTIAAAGLTHIASRWQISGNSAPGFIRRRPGPRPRQCSS